MPKKNLGTGEKIKGTVFIIVGLAGVVFLIVFLLSSQGIISIGTGPKIVSRQDLAFQELPPAFPKDLPLNEIEGRVIENYQAALSDGRILAVRVFESKLNAFDEVKEFELNSFDKVHHLLFEFLKNGWTIIETDYTETSRKLKAVKDNSELIIEISQDSASGAIKVSLSQFNTK